MAYRTKMDIMQRAKQFAPFSALKGFEEAICEKQKIVVPKIELTEESKEELNRKFVYVKKNDIVSVVYFYHNEYLKITGMVSGIDIYARILRVVNTKIPFDDIYDISLETS